MPIFSIYLYVFAMSVIYWFRLIPENRIEAFNDSLITIVCLVGSYHLFRAYLQSPKQDFTRICWLLFGFGLFCEGVGHILYSILELILNQYVPFPSIADLPIFLGILMQVGSFTLFYIYLERRMILPSLSRKMIVNTIFLFLIIAHIVFFFIPIMIDDSTSITIRVLLQIYPTVDLILAYYCIHFFLIWMTRGQEFIAKPWTFMILALSIFLITDYAYNYMIITNQYHSYQWINPGWGLAYLLISHAAYLQRKLISQSNVAEEEMGLFDRFEL